MKQKSNIAVQLGGDDGGGGCGGGCLDLLFTQCIPHTHTCVTVRTAVMKFH